MLEIIKSLGLFVTVTLIGAPALAGEAKIWNGLVTYGEDKDYFDGRGGNDRIRAKDSVGEYVFCGPGTGDKAWFDTIDAPNDCEIQNPPP